jgi:outer membrane protein
LSSQTALESTRAGFEVGTRTAVDVVTAERALFQAKRDLARARYDYIIQTLRLKQAAGSLAPEDLTAVNAWLSASSQPSP